MQMQQLHLGTWTQFRVRFLERYFPKVKRHILRREFENLVQGDNSVEQYRQEFNSLSRYATDLVSTEEYACLRFEAGLNIDIRLGLAGREYDTLGALADAAMRYERILDEKKRITAEIAEEQRSEESKGKVNRSNNRGSQGKSKGSKRTRSILGFSTRKPSKSMKTDGGSSRFTDCYNCGRPGHLARKCTNMTVCHICKKKGHTASGCPQAVCHKCKEIGHISSWYPNAPTSQ